MSDEGKRPTSASSTKSEPSGAELLGLGLALAVAVMLPLVLGLVADSAFHSSPVGVVVGLLLGIVAGGTAVYQRFKRYW